MTAVTPQSVASHRFPPQRRAGGTRFLGYLSTTDPKVLGVMYIVTSFVFFMVGGVLALLMRAELARPGLQFLAPEQYNQLFTMHGRERPRNHRMRCNSGHLNPLRPCRGLAGNAPRVRRPRWRGSHP